MQELTAELLVMATEEACLNVIQHAFEPDEEGRYEVSVEKPPLGMIIAVEDQGLAFNPALLLNKDELGQQSAEKTTAILRGLGGHLMRSVVDETTVINRGEQGKRIELFKKLPGSRIFPSTFPKTTSPANWPSWPPSPKN